MDSMDLWDEEYTLMVTVVVGVVVVVGVYVLGRFRVVPRTQVVVLERLGTVTRTVTNQIYMLSPLEGLREFRWSWDGVHPTRKTFLPLTEQVLDPPPLTVRAQSYPCTVDILVRYRISDAAVAAETSDDPLRATMINAQSKLRQLASQHSWAELDRTRTQIATELRDYIDSSVTKYGITILEVVIEGISVSDEVAEGFKMDAALEADMRNTKRRRELELYEEETKTKRLEAELERSRMQAACMAEELQTLAAAGVDVSSYLLSRSYDKLADAIASGSVTTLSIGGQHTAHPLYPPTPPSNN